MLSRTFTFALVLALTTAAFASTTWYVNGVSGSDSNNCLSTTTACKTIGHAISLAASGDSIRVAAATYPENLTIGISLKLIGSGARTTIVDGGSAGRVVTISGGAHVTLSGVTITHGSAVDGAGIFNNGTLLIVRSTVTGNSAFCSLDSGKCGGSSGGGILNAATLTISNSMVVDNSAAATPPRCIFPPCFYPAPASGGGIDNGGTALVSQSTVSGNSAAGHLVSPGGGIVNGGTMVISNSTIANNHALSRGGAIYNGRTITIYSSTISGNSAFQGGGIFGTATLQNSIVANSSDGGNCDGSMTSDGYNLSSDGTCNFNNAGDLNNTNPLLGPLQNNGGPTQTMALPSGSPAIDAGNPNGCKDSLGHLLRTDQRGKPRPDKEDTGGCDIGAYESQSD